VDKDEAFEPIRIRIMQEAYDLADRNDTEGYNAVKAMCGDVQKLIQSAYRFTPEEWQVAIVVECARFVDDYVAEAAGIHWDTGNSLKKHFGIEEKTK